MTHLKQFNAFLKLCFFEIIKMKRVAFDGNVLKVTWIERVNIEMLKYWELIGWEGSNTRLRRQVYCILICMYFFHGDDIIGLCPFAPQILCANRKKLKGENNGNKDGANLEMILCKFNKTSFP